MRCSGLFLLASIEITDGYICASSRDAAADSARSTRKVVRGGRLNLRDTQSCVADSPFCRTKKCRCGSCDAELCLAFSLFCFIFVCLLEFSNLETPPAWDQFTRKPETKTKILRPWLCYKRCFIKKPLRQALVVQAKRRKQNLVGFSKANIYWYYKSS